MSALKRAFNPMKGWRLLAVGESSCAGDRIDFYCSGGVRKSFACAAPLDSGHISFSPRPGWRIFTRRKKKPTPKPRREPLKMQFATAIQAGKNKTAVEVACEIMRILDNHQRAKRRKKETK